MAKWSDATQRFGKSSLRHGLAICAALLIVAAAILLAINVWKNTGLEKARWVATGAATLDLFVRPQVYQADLDEEVYRQIVAKSEAAQAAADHANQVSIVCRFPIQTQPPWNTQSSWDTQGVTFRFHVHYAETDAVVRVDEELKWRSGLAWVVTGVASRWEDVNPANNCR